MKFLILSDLHYWTQKEQQYIVELTGYDSCFCLGDICFDFLQTIKRIVKSEIYGICGNHDTYKMLDEVGITNIHGKCVTIGNIDCVGLQGSARYLPDRDRCMYTQTESLKLVKTLPKADVLFTHDGLYNRYADPAHQGLKGVTYYARKQKPKYIIHGHKHIASCTKYHQSTIVCVYRAIVLDTITGEIKNVF